ncbi:hypothetical protein Syun_018548 [Stephania yunnanensis]|uniref:PHD-type domain-containing protein n=1 Tax=Stephania yunnanensis TaxID=152371 RepID=A0AAP0IUS7_9MAGN
MVVPKRLKRGRVVNKGSRTTRSSVRNRSQNQSSLTRFGAEDFGVSTNSRSCMERCEGRNLAERRPIGRRGRKRCALSVCKSSREAKAAKKSILSWLIDSETVLLNKQVCYMNTGVTGALRKGRIERDGIVCSCCLETMSVSVFEAHAGSKIGDPYRNIFLETGINLLKCQTMAWDRLGESEQCRPNEVKGHENATDQNDDTCGLCGDGGNLICCDSCPSTYHQNCLGFQNIPQGDWHCPNCICKFCGLKDCNTEQLLPCYQYHQKCRGKFEDKRVPPKFCGVNCTYLFWRLQNRFGVNFEIGDGYSWSLLRHLESTPNESLHRESKRITSNSKLAIVNTVMKECFNSLVDERSGVDIIQSVVFNCRSNLNRLNFSRFFTAVLEKGDEIISAASIRIHGTKLAEMPFVVTRSVYRGQGMCRRLLNAIESTLQSFGVQYLIIPSIEERVKMWTEFYHFKPIDESLKRELQSVNYLAFPSTVLLQKVPMTLKQRNRTTNQRNEEPDTEMCAIECRGEPENRSSTKYTLRNDISQVQQRRSSINSAPAYESEAVGRLELQKKRKRHGKNGTTQQILISNTVHADCLMAIFDGCGCSCISAACQTPKQLPQTLSI